MAGRSALGTGNLLLSGQIAVLDAPDVRLAFLDLLNGLGNQKRYAGQLPVSGLHHAVICGLLAELYYPDQPMIRCYAVAHDVHECYWPDQIQPMKRLIPELKKYEKPWEAHVHTELDLAWPRDTATETAIKHIDNRAVAVEVATWHHPRREWFYPAHGGEPTAEERAVGAAVVGVPPIRLYNMMHRILPALPQGGG
jgi:hypothetical protein